jgi:hypothetical protein
MAGAAVERALGVALLAVVALVALEARVARACDVHAATSNGQFEGFSSGIDGTVWVLLLETWMMIPAQRAQPRAAVATVVLDRPRHLRAPLVRLPREPLRDLERQVP